MGVVFLAEDPTLRRQVALKVMLPQYASHPTARARFLREARSQAAVEHNHIIAIYQVGEERDVAYITMPLLKGQSLADALKANPVVPVGEAVRIAREMAEGLAAAHERGLIHRDIKPANVWLKGKHRQVKVLDFGLARAETDGVDAVTQEGAIIGTPAYMSPEQAAGDHLDSRTDLFSLGVVLYQMLTGRQPFSGKNASAILIAVTAHNPLRPIELNPQVPADLDDLTMRLLAKDPADRPARTELVVEGLRAVSVMGMIAEMPSSMPRSGAAPWESLADTDPDTAPRTIAESPDATKARSPLPLRRWMTIAAFLVFGGLAVAAADFIIRSRNKDTNETEKRGPDLTDVGVTNAGKGLDQVGNRPRSWGPILDLAPPFSTASEAFPAGGVSVAADRLTRTETVSVVPTRTPSRGPIRAEVDFALGWEDSATLGLIINLPPVPASDQVRGYVFRVVAVERSGTAESPLVAPASAPLTFRVVDGAARAEIVRDGAVLRSRLVHLAPGAPLRLAAERSGDSLRMRINDLSSLEFADPIPLLARPDAVLGLIWARGVAVSRLRVDTLQIAQTLSPLEQGDHLYQTGKPSEAVAAYLDQVRAAPNSDVATEARCKAGMVLLGLNRADEAAPLFEQVMLCPGDRWPVIAGCQLWFLRVGQKQFEEAETILGTISGRFTREQVARYVPSELRRDLRITTDAMKVNYFLPDPGQIPKLESAAKLAELMAEDGLRRTILDQLMVALFLNRQNDRAAEIGKRMLLLEEQASRKATDSGDMQSFFWAVRWYCWELRQLGQQSRAKTELNQLLERNADLTQGVAKPNGQKVGRFLAIKLDEARLFADAGKWQQSEEAIDYYLSTISRPAWNYNFVSSAHLMKGFCRLERGDAEGARQAWAAGRFPVFKEQWPVGQRPADGVPPGRTGLLDGWMLASLSNDLSDEEARQYWAALTGFLFTDAVAAQIGEAFAVSPAVFRAAWQSPRARDLARKMSFLQLHLSDHYRTPILVLAYEKLRQDLFDGKPSAEVDEILWQTTDRFGNGFLEGKVSKAQALQAAFAWKGTSGVFGWASLSPTLAPEIRGPVAYTMGLRYLKLGKLPDAKKLFRTAVTDAPAGTPLARLASEEIAKLDGKPLPQSLPVAPPPREVSR